MVRRSPSLSDARVVIVEATPASQALRTRIEQIWATLESVTVGDLTAKEQADVLALLGALERNLLDPTSAPVEGQGR